MFGEIPKRIQPYYDVIDRHLDMRNAQRGDYERDPTYKEPVYVVRMCEELAGMIGVPVEEVVKVERCASGHVDYHRKFALYCYELAHPAK